jgi:16S rRNA (uracil1498-N3)-methyltransferase
VAEPASTQDVAELVRRAALPVVLHEEATSPLAALPVPASGDVVVVVGPEGGLTDAELKAFGVEPVRLGDTVLRTSTAGVAAAALVLARSRWR